MKRRNDLTVFLLLSGITVKIFLLDLASDVDIMAELAFVALVAMTRFKVDTEDCLRILTKILNQRMFMGVGGCGYIPTPKGTF